MALRLRHLGHMHDGRDMLCARAGGGLLLHALRYGFARFADRCEAYFGYCGDARAYEVDMAAGFVPTRHRFLIAHWHRDLPDARREELIAKVHAIGPF